MGSLATALDDFIPPAGAPAGGDASAGGAAVNPGLSAPAALAGMKVQRAALRAESARLAIAARRLEAVEMVQGAAVAACDALVAKETAATLAWASSGSPGDPPQPDRAAHDELATSLTRAAQAAAAAKGACAGIGARLAELAGEMAAIDSKIDGLVLDALTVEHAQVVATANAAAATAASRIAEANSFRQFMLGMARRLQTAGRHDDGIELFRRVEKLPSAAPLIAVSDARMGEMVAYWKYEYDGMVSGDE